MLGVINWLVTQIIAAVAFIAAITGSVPDPSTSAIFAPGGTAIRGYDPVAYFADGQAVRGNQQFTYDWNGATWHEEGTFRVARTSAPAGRGRNSRAWACCMAHHGKRPRTASTNPINQPGDDQPRRISRYEAGDSIHIEDGDRAPIQLDETLGPKLSQDRADRLTIASDQIRQLLMRELCADRATVAVGHLS